MRVVLGAWGLGAFLASHSEIWKIWFGSDPHFAGTLPPMSSVFSGMVEPFPFVLASKVYIDADQYDFLLSGGDHRSWNLDAKLTFLLREFETSGILSPISYRSLLKPKIRTLVQTAEDILECRELASATAASRRLWARFLHSPGGLVLPHLSDEIKGGVNVDVQHYGKTLNIREHPKLASIVSKDQVTVAALTCGHGTCQ